jgi:Copper transport outer membrane protein, MctB
VMSGFSELHMLSLDGQNITPSTTVVVLGHGSMPAKDYAGTAELSLVAALASAGGHVVVAGDSGSARAGGLVARVRASKTDRDAVTTVDNANNSFGQVSAVLALAGASKGLVGHYGTEEGANALFPAPAK